MKLSKLHRLMTKRALQSKYIKPDVAISLAQSIKYISNEKGIEVKTSLYEVVQKQVEAMQKLIAQKQ